MASDNYKVGGNHRSRIIKGPVAEEVMANNKKKAVFVGTNYVKTDSRYIQPLDKLPYIYAKKLMENLIFKEAFTAEQCVLLTDHPGATSKSEIRTAGKNVIIAALKEIMENADKSGDSILFYFCGHGAVYRTADTKEFYKNDGHWGLLKTLNDKGDAVDPLYDSEFRSLINPMLKNPKVNFTIFIHACHGGVMFVPPLKPPTEYKGPGIAMSAVGPEVPSAIENPKNVSFSDRRDFTVFLIEQVVRPLSDKSEGKNDWPTYSEIYKILKEGGEKNPTKDGTILIPQIYCNPAVDPAKLQLLQIPK